MLDRAVSDPGGPPRDVAAPLTWAQMLWIARLFERQDAARDARIARLAAQNERLAAANAELRNVNAQLVAVNEDLASRLARLEHLVTRNSGNSSYPSSKDGQPGTSEPKPKKPRVSGGGRRFRGGQPGAPGSHLRFSEQPDERVDRFPEGRCGCGNDLATALERGQARDLGVVDRYQQVDIPLVTATVTQYDQHALACGCGAVHRAARPAGARPGPVGYGPNLQAWCVSSWWSITCPSVAAWGWWSR